MGRGVVGWCAAGLAAAVACSGGGGSKPVAKKSAPTTTPAPKPLTAPLTGLADPGGQSQGRPALVVKIENTPDARPQAGLNQADVIYEEGAEGGITRFAAVFQSTVPDVVGPIRSVRAMDPDIVWPLGGVFAYSGGAAPNIPLIQAAPVNAVDESAAGDAMFRDRSKRAPHNLYGHGDALFAKGGNPVPPPPLFSYLAPNETASGDPVLAFSVGFGRGFDVGYTYDAPSRSWQRTMDNQPFVAADGAQVAATNVVVQFTNYPAESEGETVGQGEVWVFSDGKVTKGQWSRPQREQPAQYVDAAGKPIKLLPGRTLLELLPVGLPLGVVGPPPPPGPAPSVPTSTPPTTKKK